MPSFILIFASCCIYAKAETALPSISKSFHTIEIGKSLPKSKINILRNNEQGNDSINDAADVSLINKYKKDDDSDSTPDILLNNNQESDSDYFPSFKPFQPNFKTLPHIEMRILNNAINNDCLESLEILKLCKENPNSNDCWKVNNIDDLICIINDSSNINDELSKIESNYDLYIKTNKNISLIDFSQLNHPMTVYLTKESTQDDIIVGLAGVSESQITTLIIQSIFIQIKDSPLKMNNIVLRYSQMVSDSEPIISKNIDIDTFSINNINLEKLQHENISVTISDLNNKYFRIFINESEWDILYREHGTDTFNPLFILPYTFSETLNLNVKAIFIDLCVENEDITSVKDINMAIFSPHYYTGYTDWTNYDYDKNKIVLTTSGNWKSITEAKVNITYYDEYAEIQNNFSTNVNLIDSPIYPPENSETSTSDDDPNAYPEDYPFQPESYPKRKPFSNLYITESMQMCRYYQSFIQKCKENPNDEECIYEDENGMPEEVICLSNINSINNELANINNNNDLLISTEKSIPDIDLNQLKSKKSVSFEPLEPPDNDFDLKRKSKLLKKKPKDEIIDYPDIEIGIRGNINEKVSSLKFKSESDEYSSTPILMLKVIEAPLTIDYLELRGSKISFETEAIRPNRMLIDAGSNKFMPSEIWRYIQVKQLSFYIPQRQSRMLYRISFLDNKWDLSSAFFNDPDQSYFSIHGFPYSSCGRFNLITVSHFFDLHVEKGNSKVRPINITVLSFEKQYNDYPNLLDDSKYLVHLTSSGDWTDVNSNVSVYFSGFQEYLNLENKCNSKITVSKFSLHDDGTVTPPVPDDEVPIVSTIYQPPFSTFKFSSQMIVTNDNSMCSSMKEFYEKCKETPNEEYCEPFESIEYYGCSTPKNINNELQNLPTNAYTLSILTFVDIPEIDFNKLNHKISIFLSYVDDTDDLNLLSKKEKSKDKTSRNSMLRKKISTANVGIKGNINEKVSFLRLRQITVKILDSPLNIENMLLHVSYIDSSSQKIQCQNLIVDGVTHGNFISNSDMSDKLNVTQYGIKDYQDLADDYQYRISFGKDRWSISRSSLYYDLYFGYFPSVEDFPNSDESEIDEIFGENFPIGVPDYIPYSFCERFTFIIPSNNFDLYVENDTSIAKPINITLMNLDSILLDNSKYPVKITSSGNWENISDTVSVYFTYFNNFVDLDTSSCDSKIVVTRHEAFNPITIIDSTVKNETKKADLTDIDSDKIKEELNKHFDKNDDGDQYVSINNNNKETVFTDLELEPNQYIKLQDNAEVTLSGGNLNLLLNDESSSVSIIVNNNNDVKLSIKNKAESTVNIETNSDKISINSNSEVYSPLKLTVSDGVKEIKINSINLHDSGSISATRNNEVIPITVNNLQAQAQTSGKLTKVTISTELSISETASLELENVELKRSKLNLNLHSYTYANYVSPMLHGTLGNPPSSIELIKPANGKTQPSSQEKGKQFLLFQGTFTSSCGSWKEALNYSDTFFNNAECKDSMLTLEESRSLLIYRDDETKNPNDDKDKDNNNNNKKLTSGQIAGIVVGVVGGVAIIAIIITVIIIKKKKKDNSADESDKAQVEL